jgi:hypothetical protein
MYATRASRRGRYLAALTSNPLVTSAEVAPGEDYFWALPRLRRLVVAREE